MNPPTRFSATVPSVTFSAKLISRDADLFVGCADDVDQQEEGGGMKVEGGSSAACYDDDEGAAMTIR